jgi:hypothetical protein
MNLHIKMRLDIWIFKKKLKNLIVVNGGDIRNRRSKSI